MLELYIHGKSSSEFGLSIAETPSIPSPERDVQQIPIRGRHGSLTKKYGYKDIEFDIALNILDTRGIKEQIRLIKAWILNAERLQLSDDSAYYRIKHAFIPEIDNEINLYGSFNASFVAHPFQYKDNEIVTFNSAGTLIYNGTVESLPMIRVFGAGTGQITINSKVIHLSNIDSYMDIDSENEVTFKEQNPRNDDMVGAYPVLIPGENTISWSGGITKIEIDAREAYL